MKGIMLASGLMIVVLDASWARPPPPPTKTDYKCEMVLKKNSCWTSTEAHRGYALGVEIKDQFSYDVLGEMSLSKDKGSTVLHWDCKGSGKFYLEGVFSPAIWKEDEGKIYRSIKVFEPPGAIQETSRAWRVEVCFPNDFGHVPKPPYALNKCTCDVPIEDDEDAKKD